VIFIHPVPDAGLEDHITTILCDTVRAKTPTKWLFSLSSTSLHLAIGRCTMAEGATDGADMGVGAEGCEDDQEMDDEMNLMFSELGTSSGTMTRQRSSRDGFVFLSATG
jgi:hypothetical protein